MNISPLQNRQEQQTHFHPKSSRLRKSTVASRTIKRKITVERSTGGEKGTQVDGFWHVPLASATHQRHTNQASTNYQSPAPFPSGHCRRHHHQISTALDWKCHTCGWCLQCYCLVTVSFPKCNLCSFSLPPSCVSAVVEDVSILPFLASPCYHPPGGAEQCQGYLKTKTFLSPTLSKIHALPLSSSPNLSSISSPIIPRDPQTTYLDI